MFGGGNREQGIAALLGCLRIQNACMRPLARTTQLSALAGALLAVLLAGCTVYPAPRTPTAATTTSAEQMQRILWKNVEAKKWSEVNALLAPNVVWRTGDHVLYRNDIVPWLQGIGIKGATVTDVTLWPNVNDITLVYGLQLQAEQVAVLQLHSQPGQAGPTLTPMHVAGCVQNIHAVAVWQQPQAASAPAKPTAKTAYLLTVEDLTVDTAPKSNAAGQCEGQ